MELEESHYFWAEPVGAKDVRRPVLEDKKRRLCKRENDSSEGHRQKKSRM